MTEKEQWYCFKFDVPTTNSITASDLISKMSSFMNAVESFNRAVVHSSDEMFVVTSYLEDVQTGSIRWWLMDKLHRLDDKAIEKFVDKPVKTVVASMLKELKQKAIETLEKHDGEPVQILKGKIGQAFDVVEDKYQSKLPQDLLGKGLIHVDKSKLLRATSEMSRLSGDLEGGVTFIESYDTPDEAISVCSGFREYAGEKQTEDEEITNIVTRNLVVHAPELDKEASHWKFVLDGKIINVDISVTDIATQTMRRGDVRVGDTYKVKLEETEYRTPKGQFRIRYKIIEVIDFNRGVEQLDVFG